MHPQAAPTGCCLESLRWLLFATTHVALDVSPQLSQTMLTNSNYTLQASGWLMETLLTMTLVFVVFAATDAKRAKIATHLPVSSCVDCQGHVNLVVSEPPACCPDGAVREAHHTTAA